MAEGSLDEGSRALLHAHWPQLGTPFSAEKFAAGGGLNAPLLERAREHFRLLDRTVKLRLLLGCGCLRAAEAAALAEHVTGLVHLGQADDDSWVRALASVIGAQRGVELDEDALDEGVPEEAALIERLAARAAEPSLLQPEEAAFMSGANGSAALPAAKAHFTIGGSEAARAQQRKAAADGCRLPQVAWEEAAATTKSASASGGGPKQAGKRGRDSSEDAKTEARKRAKEDYLAKRRRKEVATALLMSAGGPADESEGTMMRKDDTAFKEMEQAKALAEQETVRAKEEASALRKKKTEEREALRREECLLRGLCTHHKTHRSTAAVSGSIL